MEARRNHSLGLRVWHWLDGGVVVGLIATFFLRDSLVGHSRFLVASLNANGIAISDAAAKPIIKEMVNQLWTWHIYLGYALTALFVLRCVLFFTDKRNPVHECWKSFCELRGHFDFRNIHSTAVKSGYLVFYFLQLFMILSGLTLTFSDSLGLQREFRHTINEAHETVMWFFLAFVIAHIMGVVIAENRENPGIVSAMIKPPVDR